MTTGPGPIGSVSIGAACALFDVQGRVLLVKHTYGRLNWDLPGGICLPDEPPSSGAERELEEETGLRLTAAGLSGVYYERDHWTGAMLHFVFHFDPSIAGEPVAADDEIGEVGWFQVDDLPAPISDFTERRVRDALLPEVAYAVVSGRQWRL